MKENQNQSLKKGLITILIIIIVVFIGLYIYKWMEVKEEAKYQNSYLIETNTISLEMNDLDEISSVLSETPSYYFIYVSYNNDKDIYDFEKKLKPLIDEYDLQNNFYYLNITNIKENYSNYKDELSKRLSIEKNAISKIPAILYFNDNQLENSSYSISDFEKLLKSLDIKPL